MENAGYWLRSKEGLVNIEDSIYSVSCPLTERPYRLYFYWTDKSN